MPAAAPRAHLRRNDRSFIRTWFNAARPRSFTTSTVPIVAATALAMVDGLAFPDLFVFMLLASIFTHAACNFTNDYFDDRRGVDTATTLGQGGALQSGAISHTELRNAIVICFGLALLFAIPVIVTVGPVIILIGIFSAAAAYLYTAGPYPLAYYALGEVTVFLAMGIGMVCGAYYVNTETLTTPAVLLAIAVGCLAAAFLHANNIRDIESDRMQNKRTLANLLRFKWAVIEYIALVFLPYGLSFAMIAVKPVLYPVLIVWVTFPSAFKLVERVAISRSLQERNAVTRRTAGLHLRYTSLISLGLLISALLNR